MSDVQEVLPFFVIGLTKTKLTHMITTVFGQPIMDEMAISPLDRIVTFPCLRNVCRDELPSTDDMLRTFIFALHLDNDNKLIGHPYLLTDFRFHDISPSGVSFYVNSQQNGNITATVNATLTPLSICSSVDPMRKRDAPAREEFDALFQKLKDLPKLDLI